MIQRNAANQGANIQQQSAGQAATLQANQSLNALNSMGQLATNQANQQANATSAYTNAAQGEQGQILGAIQGPEQLERRYDRLTRIRLTPGFLASQPSNKAR